MHQIYFYATKNDWEDIIAYVKKKGLQSINEDHRTIMKFDDGQTLTGWPHTTAIGSILNDSNIDAEKDSKKIFDVVVRYIKKNGAQTIFKSRPAMPDAFKWRQEGNNKFFGEIPLNVKREKNSPPLDSSEYTVIVH